MKKIKVFFFAVLLGSTAMSQIPTNGLVAYYPFNGNANDESGNGNNGIVNGATLTTDRFGNANKAYSFNGTSAYINVDSSLSLNTANMVATSICGWFYTTTTTSGFILRHGTTGTNGGIGHEIVWSGNTDSKLDVTNWWLNQNPKFSASSNVLSLNKWHFFAIVYDYSTNNEHFYIDSILVGSYSSTLHKATNPILNIGRNTNVSTYFNGQIDDIRIYNVTLSSTEISALYKEHICTPTTINDTTTYHISDIKYASINPIKQFIKTDSLKTIVGGCDSVINRYVKFVSSPTYCSFTDTINVTQTKLISITDTLLINVSLTGSSINTNIIKVYPNPTKDRININFGNVSSMIGYSVKILNSIGISVYSSAISQSSVIIDMNSWSGKGTYIIQIIDSNNNVIDTRKIILE